MAMPSAVWSGHLHFGLVAMPVRLLVAARTKTTRFRRLYRKPVNESTLVASFPSFSRDLEDQNSEGRDSDLTEEVGERPFTPEEMNDWNTPQHQYSTVRQVLQSEATGEEVRPDQMLKGYEIAPNEFAAINPQEIKAAEIETSDTIDLFHFVKTTKVDPIYFERSYYVTPDSGAEKGYALLLAAMRKEECLGIARIGMHRREHMLILRPSEDYLVAYTMFYANEVRPAPRLELITEFSNKELSMATALIKGYEGDFDPKQFKDIYQERIRKIIETQVDNRIEKHPGPTSSTSRVPDLMEQIRLSLAQIESKKPDANLSKKPGRKALAIVKKKPQRVRA
jgi:DNA end-binding protein Ku